MSPPSHGFKSTTEGFGPLPNSGLSVRRVGRFVTQYRLVTENADGTVHSAAPLENLERCRLGTNPKMIRTPGDPSPSKLSPVLPFVAVSRFIITPCQIRKRHLKAV